MRKITSLILVLITIVASCKKDSHQLNPSDTLALIERDSLFLQWGQAANGRWVVYGFEKVDRKSLNSENPFLKVDEV